MTHLICVLFLFAAALLNSTDATLQDVLNSAIEKFSKMVNKTNEAQENKAVRLIEEGRWVLKSLTVELNRLGRNAYNATIPNKDELVQEQASECASKKGDLANMVFTATQAELRQCYQADALSMLHDVTAPVFGNVKSDCEEEDDLKHINIAPLEGFKWGIKVMAVHKCVENVIKQITSTYMGIFRGFRAECLAHDFLRNRAGKGVVSAKVNTTTTTTTTTSTTTTTGRPPEANRAKFTIPRPSRRRYIPTPPRIKHRMLADKMMSGMEEESDEATRDNETVSGTEKVNST